MKGKALAVVLMAVACMLSMMIVSQTRAQGWEAMTSGTTDPLYAVWGTSGSAVYAAGAGGTIVYYNGSTWSPVTSSTTNIFKGIWGSSANDVFFAGTLGTMLHYNGSTLNQMTLPGGYESVNLHEIWGSSGSDVFAVGDGGTILHYNGTAWSAMTSGTGSTLFGIWGSSGSDVFAVGGNIILHYNGTTWSPMTNPVSGNLYGVWGASGSDVHAVGYDGTASAMRHLHYNGTSWSTVDSTATGALSGVWGSSSNDVFVVAAAGLIAHYTGSWANMTSNTSTDLNAVWGSSGSDVFAVGNNGTIIHYGGSGSSSTTTTIDSSTTTTIRRLCPFRHSAAREADVQPLRDLRDAQLESSLGSLIAAMYYENIDEIGDILRDDAGLRRRFNRLTMHNMPVVRQLLSRGEATIGEADLLNDHEFLSDLKDKAGVKLAVDIDFILRGIEYGWLPQWLGITVE
jgi:hypothetical protein